MFKETTTTKKNPWEQLKGEKSRQHLSFCRYLELGNKRTFNKIAAYANITPRTVGNWAKKWNWEERASAFDRYIIREKDKIKRRQFAEAELIHSEVMIKTSQLIFKLIGLINDKTVSELDKMSDMELIDVLKNVKSLTTVLPSLSDIASSNMSRIKPMLAEDENPLDIMAIYDKKPELIEDVSDLLSKIVEADEKDDSLISSEKNDF